MISTATTTTIIIIIFIIINITIIIIITTTITITQTTTATTTTTTTIIIIIIIIMGVFLERLSIGGMLNCAEQVQIQKFKTHAYETPQTARVQTIMLKHPTKQ